jgi:hypothetical protein
VPTSPVMLPPLQLTAVWASTVKPDEAPPEEEEEPSLERLRESRGGGGGALMRETESLLHAESIANATRTPAATLVGANLLTGCIERLCADMWALPGS